MQDLRHRVLRLVELRRRHDAHDRLTAVEQAELEAGIPAVEYAQIIADIRRERRSAAPSKAARRSKAAAAAPATTPPSLDDFLTKENEAPK